MSLKPNKGLFYSTAIVHVYFGDERLPLSNISSLFSQTHELTQVHGSDVIPATKGLPLADGHHTTNLNSCLVIKTADCTPAFLTDGTIIMGLHIGWRGLAKKILTSGAKIFPDTSLVRLWIGPHIRQTSFELDTVCAEQLLSPHYFSIENARNHGILKPSFRQKNHWYVDMLSLLKREASDCGIKKIHDCGINTFTSPTHYSYRRNRFQNMRNYSFIVKSQEKNAMEKFFN